MVYGYRNPETQFQNLDISMYHDTLTERVMVHRNIGADPGIQVLRGPLSEILYSPLHVFVLISLASKYKDLRVGNFYFCPIALVPNSCMVLSCLCVQVSCYTIITIISLTGSGNLTENPIHVVVILTSYTNGALIIKLAP